MAIISAPSHASSLVYDIFNMTFKIQLSVKLHKLIPNTIVIIPMDSSALLGGGLIHRKVRHSVTHQTESGSQPPWHRWPLPWESGWRTAVHESPEDLVPALPSEAIQLSPTLNGEVPVAGGPLAETFWELNYFLGMIWHAYEAVQRSFPNPDLTPSLGFVEIGWTQV